MNKSPIAPCPSCARYVRLSEASCPFCSVALPQAFREQARPASTAGRLNRAALHALRMGAISMTAAACGGSLTTAGDGGGTESDSASVEDTAQGGSGSGGGSSGSGGGGLYDGPWGAVLYGGFFPSPDAGVRPPPNVDSGPDVAIDAASDAGPQYDAPFIGAAYGGWIAPPYGGFPGK